MSEFEFEPVRGLPARLPPGERLLWQGSPDWRALARRAFHTRQIAAYFVLLALWRLIEGVAAGTPMAQVALGCAWLLLLGATVVGLVLLLAWLTARATVYTITDKRVVLRHGIALPLSVNLPYAIVESVALKPYADGTGDLALSLVAGQRLGYLLNWPHVRPWQLARPESALRTLPDARAVADLLLAALGAAAVTSAAADEPAVRTLAQLRPASLSGAALAAKHGVAA